MNDAIGINNCSDGDALPRISATCTAIGPALHDVSYKDDDWCVIRLTRVLIGALVGAL